MTHSHAADDPQAGYLLAPKAFRAAAQRVLPSLVTIETYGGVRPGAARSRPALGISKPGDGPTTGLVISPDGYIVTSTYNFLKQPPVITVTLRDGTRHIARLLGRDETRKLCLLKIDDVKDLPIPAFAPRDEIRVGQWAVSLGVGYGDQEPALSAGIVSAARRIFGKAIQTDANTSPANYGGPLIDVDARVIGICVPLSPDSSDAAAGSQWYDSGIGFAVPLSGADELLAQLKEGKIIQQGRLGIVPKVADALGGVAIAQVVAGSPASKAGLEVEDEIVKVGSERIFDLMHLRGVLGRCVAGQELAVDLRRGEKDLHVTITLDAGSDQAVGPAKPQLKE